MCCTIRNNELRVYNNVNLKIEDDGSVVVDEDCDIIGCLSNITESIKKMQFIKKNNNNKLSEVDKKCNALMHSIEIEGADIELRRHYADLLFNALQERRSIKNTIALTEAIYNTFSRVNMGTVQSEFGHALNIARKLNATLLEKTNTKGYVEEEA